MSAPGLGMNDGLPGEHLEGGVVIYVQPAAALGQCAAVAVVGELAEADVGDDEQIGHRILQTANGLGHDSRLAGGVASRGVLGSGDAEKDDAADAQVGDLLAFGGEQVGRDLVVARHGADWLTKPPAGSDEQGQDQVGRTDRHLADQVADGRMVSKPSHSRGGKAALHSMLRVVHLARLPLGHAGALGFGRVGHSVAGSGGLAGVSRSRAFRARSAAGAAHGLLP